MFVANELPIHGFITIREASPSADTGDQDGIEVYFSRLDESDHFHESRSVFSIKPTKAIIDKWGAYDFDAVFLCIGQCGSYLSSDVFVILLCCSAVLYSFLTHVYLPFFELEVCVFSASA